jgi:hypothetical protein
MAADTHRGIDVGTAASDEECQELGGMHTHPVRSGIVVAAIVTTSVLSVVAYETIGAVDILNSHPRAAGCAIHSREALSTGRGTRVTTGVAGSRSTRECQTLSPVLHSGPRGTGGNTRGRSRSRSLRYPRAGARGAQVRE